MGRRKEGENVHGNERSMPLHHTSPLPKKGPHLKQVQSAASDVLAGDNVCEGGSILLWNPFSKEHHFSTP